jgi:hypothetical protein
MGRASNQKREGEKKRKKRRGNDQNVHRDFKPKPDGHMGNFGNWKKTEMGI